MSSIVIARAEHPDIHLTRREVEVIFEALDASREPTVTEVDYEKAHVLPPTAPEEGRNMFAEAQAAWREFSEYVTEQGYDPEKLQEASYTFIAKGHKSADEVFASVEPA